MFVSVILGSCLDAPEYSTIPSIKFKRLEFIDAEGVDSLNLTFDFEDGNGDIGFYRNEYGSPYQPFYAVLYYDSTRKWMDGDKEETGGYFWVSISDTLVKPPFYLADNQRIYTDTAFSSVDNRPEFDCRNYYFEYDAQAKTSSDTFFVFPNKYHSNLNLKFFKKKNGQYREARMEDEFEHLKGDCASLPVNLRIPIFDSERLGKSTVGNITFSFTSSGIVPFLAQDTFKLQFYIYDRELNKSNVVNTPDYTLFDLLKE